MRHKAILEATLIPEWKSQYLDYDGLQKQMKKAVRQIHAGKLPSLRPYCHHHHHHTDHHHNDHHHNDQPSRPLAGRGASILSC
jgi:SPX domain protein involved in polyphosphate accumulation